MVASISTRFHLPVPNSVAGRGVATGTVPGLSAASPAGREFQAKAEEAAAAAQNEQDELAMAGETPGDPEPEIPTG